VRIKGPGSVIFGKADAGYDTETEALAESGGRCTRHTRHEESYHDEDVSDPHCFCPVCREKRTYNTEDLPF
jgi:hypothetical protein